MKFSSHCFQGRLAAAFVAIVLPMQAARAADPAAAPVPVLMLDGTTPGALFEGVGAVTGGGGTSVLLKDYPEPQRSQILDILFKPKFAAAMQTMYVEVGSDGNSTQGTEPTHMRARDDANFRRGYEWWIMAEAKRRNPALLLDACAWGCPGWIGNGNYWSQDMCDYYVAWIKGLKTTYGLELDAIGCRNERGSNPSWVKQFRKTLDGAGLHRVRIHAFDDPGDHRMWGWIPQLASDPELAAAIDVVGNHCLPDLPPVPAVRAAIERAGKPIWNTEEHIYDDATRHYADAFECALGAVHRFNINYLEYGATRIVNWYLAGSTYPIEPFAEQPPALFANSPWSGSYALKPIIWSYAHYGQFTEIGWRYVKGGCAELAGGGSVVTLRSATGDYSIIAETAAASGATPVRFVVGAGLSREPLCVWKTTREAQFVRQPDVVPAADGTVELRLDPKAIYSLSTTRGQQKGGFTDVPEAKPFPFPYHDDFDHYADAAAFGYLPHYTADICGVFELANRPGGGGKCLRQVVNHKAQSWAPEWKPYTVIGNADWSDYEVSASIAFDAGGWAGVMGRISQTGNGWEGNPNGYYARLGADGACAIYLASEKISGSRDRMLAWGTVPRWQREAWHKLTLRFEGPKLTLLVDDEVVLSVTDVTYDHGMAGLMACGDDDARRTALFDDLVINRPRGGAVPVTTFAQDAYPIYGGQDRPGQP
jgi:galactosylceramidase